MQTWWEKAKGSASIKTALTYLKGTPVSPESAEYVAWRQRFLRDRLSLATQIAFASSLTFTILRVFSYYPSHPNAALWLVRDGAVLLSLFACSALQKTQLGRNRPGLLFLGLCWSLTLFTQVANSLSGSADDNVDLWTLVFLTLAALIPVRWPLHVVSQLGVLACYFGLNAALGLTANLSLSEGISISLFQFWACFICDLAVYLYERLQRAEFQSRRSLQVFVHAVSHDLRTPVLSNLKVLQQLLHQPEAKVSIARSTLGQMLESGDRQLNLINSLLERARTVSEQQGNASAGGRRLATWVKTVLTYLRRVLGPRLLPVTPVGKAIATTEYEVWRRSFLLNRLHLVGWIALSCTLTLFVPDLYKAIFEPKERAVLLIYLAIVLSLLAWFVLKRTQLGRKYAGFLFLSFAWIVLLIPQVGNALLGFADPNTLIWTLVFLMLATLIPVHWPLHVVSQLSAFIGYLAVNGLLGLDPKIALSSAIGIGWYLFWVCFICDLSVYLYERLQHAEFESRRQLRVFLHAVSHDLRTPVLGSLMVLQNLLNQPGETVSVARSLPERMIQSSKRQLRLINSLLEAHSSEAQGVVCNCEPLQLSTLIQSAIADLEPLLVQNQVVLTNLVPADLPLVNADPTQLWRVFENLITNALKYNLPGVSLTLKAEVEAEMVRCSVQDNGVGISPESTQLFELYARGDRVRRTPGLGLGLYLCRQIVTAHGGEIDVISSPGAGATFWFTLPISNTTRRK